MFKVFDYKCQVCGIIELDVLVHETEADMRDCSACSSKMLKWLGATAGYANKPYSECNTKKEFIDKMNRDNKR